MLGHAAGAGPLPPAGSGGNIVVCDGPRGVLLVDADFAEMADKIVATVGSLGCSPVRAVINTHWHYDHVGGNAALAEAGALVIAHETASDHMASAQHVDVIDQDVPASPPAALPVIAVADSLVLHWGEQVVGIHHVPPAHTDGDLLVHFPAADVLHVGDIFFNPDYS